MRRLPLYCEVGPTILLTTAGEEINFATREGVSSLFVFCVCYSVCLLPVSYTHLRAHET